MSGHRSGQPLLPHSGALSSPRRPPYGGAAATSSQRTASTSHLRQASRGQSEYPSGDMDSESMMASGYTGSRRRSITSGGANTNWANDASRYGVGPDDYGTFFVPSYLRHSRYMERLRKTCITSDVHDQEQGNRSVAGRHIPHSTSSSSVNLSKTCGTSHVHRRVVQDVVERLPSHLAIDENLAPLPSRWNNADKQQGLAITADGTEVKFAGGAKSQDEAAAVRANFPMPKACGIFYFEITVLSRTKDLSCIGIGFCSPKASLSRAPGWEAESWGYHGDDGIACAATSQGKTFGPRFNREDVIGCGVNFRTGVAFFTKNGVHLGDAFHGIKASNLYPTVGLKKANEHLRVNFGRQPFVFDIDSMMLEDKQAAMNEISKTDVSALNPPDDEDTLIKTLVGQYLAHDGYIETAKVFSKEVNTADYPLSGKQPYQLSNEEDDIHAIQRQRIRRSILDGDVDRALKYTTSYYPHVLETGQNRDVYFRLRCRKFIEMMKRSMDQGIMESSPVTATKRGGSFGSDGHDGGMRDDSEEDDEDDEDKDHDVVDAEDDEDDEEEDEEEEEEGDDEDGEDDDGKEDEDDEDESDTQMELDDQFQRETSDPLIKDDDHMEISQELPPRNSKLKGADLLTASILYGQELRQEFGNDPKPQNQKHLNDIFSVMAYHSYAESPVSHLFDVSGRAQIAEEVNGAILVSLGKPSDAVLETLYATTEVLLDDTARKTGGAAALINLRRDFLQP